MKVLVVGGGGREHAICWKLKQSPRVTELFCAPGNGGIAEIATCVPIKATDVEAMVEFAKKEQFDLVFVAPDDPLALGMVDKMEEAGLRAFGPHANAAIVEASKAFSNSSAVTVCWYWLTKWPKWSNTRTFTRNGPEVANAQLAQLSTPLLL